MKTPEFALGRQLNVEFYHCSAQILADCGRLRNIFVASAQKAGATVLEAYFHSFEPQGSSGVVIIAESHFAVHAWPEYGYAAVDIFTCSDRVDFDVAILELQQGMKSGAAVVSRAFSRGLVNSQEVETASAQEFRSRLAETTPNWRTRYEESNAVAMSVQIDLHDCCRLEALGDWLAAVNLPQESVTIRRSPAGRTVYLDVFGYAFFEPRPLAEAALAHFGGGHYKMQVNLRY